MIRDLAEGYLSSLSEWVAAQMGLFFPPERWRDLDRGIGAVAREFEFKAPETCVEWLLSAPLSRSQVEVIASHLTVGETYFFRDPRTFDALQKYVLPELTPSRQETGRHLRIWSAGCATGEEPYSIAMVLNEAIPDLKNWHITVLATDINPQFLRKAALGVYTQWSFRENPEWVKEKYFRGRKDGRFEILSSLKEMVVFSYLNLAADPFPSLLTNTNAMDIIFCRNVLMYFAPLQAKKVIENFHGALAEGGWLMVSPTEASLALTSPFVARDLSGAVLYQKDSNQARRSEEGLAPEMIKQEVSTPIFLDWKRELPSVGSAAMGPGDTLSAHASCDTQERSPIARAPAFVQSEPICQEEASGQSEGEGTQNHASPQTMILLARTKANQGRLSEALACCDQATAADSLNPVCHYLRAAILLEQGSLGEARQSLQRALYVDQDFVLAHFVLGNLALRRGRRRESKKHFENALSLLEAYRQEEVLPESDGITAGRMQEIIRSTISQERVV